MATITAKQPVLKGIVDAMHLTDKCRFNFSDAGIVIKAVDAAKVAMVRVDAPKAAFERYEVPEIPIDVDVSKLKDVIKMTSATDLIQMDISTSSITFRIGNTKRIIRLLANEGYQDARIPNLNLPAKVTMPVAELKNAVRVAKSISDYVEVIISEKGANFKCGSETEQSETFIPADLCAELIAAPDGDARSLFPIDYFNSMANNLPDGMVMLSLGINLPVKFTSQTGINIMYMLAPRIEND